MLRFRSRATALHILFFLLFSLVTLLSFPALSADNPSNQVLAETLFQEGKRLMGEKHFAEAATKFEESQRLDPGWGTLVAWAMCFEELNRTASAWGKFNEALDLATRENDRERIDYATSRVAKLESRIIRLNILFSKPDPAYQLYIDGTQLRPATWSIPIPVDPGTHTIRAQFPESNDWETSVTFTVEGETVTVTIPAPQQKPVSPILAPTAQSSAAVVPSSVAEDSSATWRTLGWSLAGVGAGAVALGSAFGIVSIVKESEAEDLCHGQSTCPTSSALATSNAALDASETSDIAFATGAITLGIGIAILLTTKPSPQSSQGKLRLDKNAAMWRYTW